LSTAKLRQWGCAARGFILLWATSGFWQMLAASILLAINWTTIMPLIETVAARGIRTGTLHYGRVRLWGSLSFIAANLGSGIIIGLIGAKIVLPLLVAGTVLVVLGAHLLPRDLDGRKRAPTPLRGVKLADAFRLAHAQVFPLFLLAGEPDPGEPCPLLPVSARCIGAPRALLTARSGRFGRSA
jgi:PPP family 3-phenylpropionic acid transporter